MTYNSKVLD